MESKASIYRSTAPFAHNAGRAPARRLKARIELCYRCNLRCRMCDFSLPENLKRQRRGGDGLDVDPLVFERFVDEILPLSRECIVGVRAEPMMSRHFGAYLRRIAASGVPNIQLHTNGTLLTERRARLLCDLEVSVLILSVDGMFKRTFEHIRPGSNFDKLMANHRRLLAIRGDRRRPVIQWNFVMMRQNLRELPGVVDLAADMGVEVVHAFHMVVHKDLDYAGESCYICPEETNAVMALARERAAVRNVRLHLPAPLPVSGSGTGPAGAGGEAGAGKGPTMNGSSRTGPACGCPWEEVVVTHSGDVHPCVFWYKDPPLGNLKASSFAEIWNGEPYRRLRSSPPDDLPHYSCNHCPVLATLRGMPHGVFFNLP